MKPAAAIVILVLSGALAATAAPVRDQPARVEVRGKQIEYTASPGAIELKREDGSLRGSIFYTAYQRSGLRPKQRAKRPVLFLFNGGPGSSSAWLHLGAFGPRRLALGEAGLVPAKKPYRTIANQYSLIDTADLVFIDPIGTGFSRATDPLAARAFYSFRGDVRSIAEFIGLYLARQDRLSAPCLIAGESYGAMRACGLVPELEEKHGIVVNGIVLISGPIVLGRRQPPDLTLPTAAATAHFHRLLEPELQAMTRPDLLRRVSDFVDERYRPALSAGRLDPATAKSINAELRSLTGLRNLGGLRFSLREARVNAVQRLGVESIGIYDTRVLSTRRHGLFRGSVGDPALELIREPMDAVMSEYLTGELGYQTGLDYKLLTRIPMWSHLGSRASDTLTRAFQTNRGLRVFVACGYYDTVTPMGVVRRAVEEADIQPAQREQIRYKNYEGGHMMYTNLPSLEALSSDLRAFIREASKRERGPALIPTMTISPGHS